MTSGVDQSYAEKSKKWRSLDDNIKVHDLSYDELPNKANVQLGWELEDAMTTQVSNNEILGDVYLPQVEKYEDWMNQQPEFNSYVQHESKYFHDKPEMQSLTFDQGGDFEISMNMHPISDDEQQWNGEELANVQLSSSFIPTAPGEEGSVDFGG